MQSYKRRACPSLSLSKMRQNALKRAKTLQKRGKSAPKLYLKNRETNKKIHWKHIEKAEYYKTLITDFHAFLGVFKGNAVLKGVFYKENAFF